MIKGRFRRAIARVDSDFPDFDLMAVEREIMERAVMSQVVSTRSGAIACDGMNISKSDRFSKFSLQVAGPLQESLGTD